MFVILPYYLRDPAARYAIPAANTVLVIANILCFFFGWTAQLAVGPGTGLLSVFTYAFAHADVPHLAGNMLVLLVVGTPVNRRIGNRYYLALYLGTALALGLFARLFCNGYLLGASGAINAVIAACVLLLPSAIVQMFYFALFPITLLIGLFRRPTDTVFWFIRWERFEMRAFWGIFLVPMLELWGLYWTGWNWTNLGHLFGLICGVAAVVMMPQSITIPRRAAWDA